MLPNQCHKIPISVTPSTKVRLRDLNGKLSISSRSMSMKKSNVFSPLASLYSFGSYNICIFTY